MKKYNRNLEDLRTYKDPTLLTVENGATYVLD